MKYFLKLLPALLLIIALAGVVVPHLEVAHGAGETADLNDIDPLKHASEGKTPSGATIHGKQINNIIDLIGVLAWAFPSVMGAMALLMVVVAGFLMVTAAGNEEKIERAKMHLFYIAAGMGALLMAYAVINFVILRLITPPNLPLPV